MHQLYLQFCLGGLSLIPVITAFKVFWISATFNLISVELSFLPFARYHVRNSVYNTIPISVDQTISNMWKLLTGIKPFASRKCWYERKAIDVPGSIRVPSSGTRNNINIASLDEIFTRAKSTTNANITKRIAEPNSAIIPISSPN